MKEKHAIVNPIGFKFLKTGLLSLVVSAVVIISSPAYGGISPETGGPVLTVVNNTEWDMQVGVGFTNGGVIDPIVVVAPSHKTSELEFISSDGKVKYQFGVPGTSSGSLIARAAEWPEKTMSLENGKILVNLKKNSGGKTVLFYKNTILPFYDQDYEDWKSETPKVDWVLEWNTEKMNGWKLTLKQSTFEISTK